MNFITGLPLWIATGLASQAPLATTMFWGLQLN